MPIEVTPWPGPGLAGGVSGQAESRLAGGAAAADPEGGKVAVPETIVPYLVVLYAVLCSIAVWGVCRKEGP
jgi:hypothetical protein